MNFQFSLEKKINKFGQKAKIFEKNENAHEIRKKQPFYVRACNVEDFLLKLAFQIIYGQAESILMLDLNVFIELAKLLGVIASLVNS